MFVQNLCARCIVQDTTRNHVLLAVDDAGYTAPTRQHELFPRFIWDLCHQNSRLLSVSVWPLPPPLCPLSTIEPMPTCPGIEQWSVLRETRAIQKIYTSQAIYVCRPAISNLGLVYPDCLVLFYVPLTLVGPQARFGDTLPIIWVFYPHIWDCGAKRVNTYRKPAEKTLVSVVPFFVIFFWVGQVFNCAPRNPIW